ncbi:Lrp/AsnC family transcriptional regulator [Thalassotalea atypica]|uniref:Lrp/AsnC family transcriptional regulator n=1 Tax=Thalassotalea atypica TaxID=2054316 RepID=UPI0025723D3A|nr:Lrp/AsnC family transcriptional regulator [Thalassotalea atypica]
MIEASAKTKIDEQTDRKRTHEVVELTPLDKGLINLLQHGLPVCERPFEVIANELNSTEEEVITHLNQLLESKVLSRFGPMFDAACLGGAFTLAALAVPDERFEAVTAQVNSFEQIAHNYRRTHQYNMWFVIATESQQEIYQVIEEIENMTGLEVLNAPKLEEFYVGLYLPV